MYFRRPFVQFCICAVLLLLCGAVAAEESVRGNIVGRDKERVYVISNVPEDEIMRPVCGEALLRKDHCMYVPLGKVGMFGSKKSDLVDYNWRKQNETVVVIDRAKLDVGQKVSLQRLTAEMFPTIEESKKTQVLLRAQNVGERAWQALIDVPEAMWLEKGIPDLMNAVGECNIVREVQSVAMLSGSPTISSFMLDWFRYGTKQQFGLDKWQEFRDTSGLTHKIIAINWNSGEECTPDIANEVLPEDLRQFCDESGADRMGLTPWDRFCREAIADVRTKDGIDYWVLRAPTEKHLNTLAQTVVKANYTGGPFRIDLCDLTHVKSLAVGTYLAGPDLNRDRLVLQQELETGAQQSLQAKVKSMYSAQNWGALVQNVLGDSDASPFRDSGGAKKVVQATNADALLVLWVRDASPKIEYSSRMNRLTPELQPFNEQEPEEPKCEDRTWNGSHEYPGKDCDERRSSDKFREDYRNWENEHERWARSKREYDNKYANYQVNYEYEVYSTPKVSLRGYLKIIDLKTQTQLWTCEVALEQSGGQENIDKIPVQIRGEGRTPQQPRLPENLYEWNNATFVVGQEAFLAALRQGLNRLADSALWPNDLKSWNAAEDTGGTMDVGTEEPAAPASIAIECVGVMPCAATPTGAAKTKLAKAALNDAIDQILAKAQADYPSASITREMVAGSVVVKSEGWNPSAKEYRVRVSFQTTQ